MSSSNNEPVQGQSNSASAVVKKKLGNNNASVGRWIACFFILFGAYLLIQGIAAIIIMAIHIEGDFSWMTETLATFIGFGLLFFVSVFVIRTFMKTKFRDFVFGVKGKLNVKLIRNIFLLWLLGLLLGTIYDLLLNQSTVTINPLGIPSILVNLVIAIVFAWMQTSYEEILFRGIPLRAACGNNLKPSVKCIIFGVVSSAIFMSLHLANPEMLTQSTTIDIIAGASGYFLMGLMMYLVNIVFGDLTPGLFIHWINNFYGFAILTQSVSAIKTGAIFLQQGTTTGVGALTSVLLMYGPIIIYAIVTAVRRNKAKSASVK